MALLRQGARGSLPDGLDVLPRAPAPPLLVAGLAQQTPAWIGAHMDACLAYPGAPDDHARRSAAWRQVAGDKPYASFIHLDLAEDPDAPLRRFRFGAQAGRHALARELHALRAAGVQHIGLHLRRNQRPLADTLHEIAEHVLPQFHGGGVPASQAETTAA